MFGQTNVYTNRIYCMLWIDSVDIRVCIETFVLGASHLLRTHKFQDFRTTHPPCTHRLWRHYENNALAYACMALDPPTPIRCVRNKWMTPCYIGRNIGLITFTSTTDTPSLAALHKVVPNRLYQFSIVSMSISLSIACRACSRHTPEIHGVFGVFSLYMTYINIQNHQTINARVAPDYLLAHKIMQK